MSRRFLISQKKQFNSPFVLPDGKWDAVLELDSLIMSVYMNADITANNGSIACNSASGKLKIQVPEDVISSIEGFKNLSEEKIKQLCEINESVSSTANMGTCSYDEVKNTLIIEIEDYPASYAKEDLETSGKKKLEKKILLHFLSP